MVPRAGMTDGESQLGWNPMRPGVRSNKKGAQGPFPYHLQQGSLDHDPGHLLFAVPLQTQEVHPGMEVCYRYVHA